MFNLTGEQLFNPAFRFNKSLTGLNRNGAENFDLSEDNRFDEKIVLRTNITTHCN